MGILYAWLLDVEKARVRHARTPDLRPIEGKGENYIGIQYTLLADVDNTLFPYNK
jgi:hypothetical protein